MHCLRTCTHRYPSGECVSLLFSPSWRLIRDLIAFLIATAAVSQEINTCNIHGNTIVWFNKHWGGRESEKKQIGRPIPVAHIISVYCVLRRRNDPRLYISAHNACRVSRTSQIPPIMAVGGWVGGGEGEADACATVNNVSRWEPGPRHVHFISIHNSLADVGLYRIPGICKESAEIATSLWSCFYPPLFIYLFYLSFFHCFSVAMCNPLTVLTQVSSLDRRWESLSSLFYLVLFPFFFLFFGGLTVSAFTWH